MKKFEIFFGIIKVPIDFITTILAFWTAYQLRLITEPIKGIAKPLDAASLPSMESFINFSLLSAIFLILIFIIRNLYTLKTTLKFNQEIRLIISSCIIWGLLIMSGFFFTLNTAFSRLTAIYIFGLTVIFIIIGRGGIKLIQYLFLKNNIGRRNLAFIGNNNLTEKIAKKLQKDARYNLIGIIGDDQRNSKLQIIGNTNNLEELIIKHNIDEIIQTESHKDIQKDEEIIDICDLSHVNYRFIPDMLQVRSINIEVQTMGEIPIINLKSTPLDGWGKVLKRLIDIIGSTIGIIILSPVMFLTALAIKLDSKGPILFSKLDDDTPVTRIGRKGKPFHFYKFRTMQPKTHSLRYTELAKNNTREEGPLVKIKNDPRVTTVGRFIRKYSIDELPQLFQVFRGHMSLVGPRPHLPEEVAKYMKTDRFVLTIKPGITGLPQINGRSDLSFKQEVKLDRYYIENWTVWMDIKIILKTIFIALRGHQE
ncbi:hypothetical protein CVV38_04305 [Candidatus Peregrinibacteria bacterium HGW-Peregrinibacteria-1]|jgi:exopolysaccharide biosynthesis polyprenyl glycosylphosphotransferase|nr:MAG: hypothetical protein CVV38_04305 [Candidatus Peregrinibacteria bacterium HGW-Peregrinibacteria-1]